MSGKPLVLSAISRNSSLYETVSENLLAAIRDAGLGPGSKIPSERELGEQFGVSRTVIREAIRHLAAKGVLEVVSGSGAQVADVGHEGVTESIDLYLRQRGPIVPDSIFEVRETLELKVTELASQRATADQLAHILDVCEHMSGVLDDPIAASKADMTFHRAIAEATGNQLFLVLVDSLGDVLYEMRRATLGDPRRGKVALESHRAIAAALEKRDSQLAVKAMKDHLSDSLHAFSRAQSTA